MEILNLEDYKLQQDIKIERFVWNAVLDERVCELCSSLDGKIIDANDPEYQIYQPALHPRCRCVWQPLTSSDNIPDANWVEPDISLITKFAPFLFAIPDKSSKTGILEISPFAPEAPETIFDPNEIVDITEFTREDQVAIRAVVLNNGP